MPADANGVRIGTEALSHGSLTAAHGRYFVAGICECDACDDGSDFAAWHRIPYSPRYALAAKPRGRAFIKHVRRGSFTVCRD